MYAEVIKFFLLDRLASFFIKVAFSLICIPPRSHFLSISDINVVKMAIYLTEFPPALRSIDI